MCIRDSGRETHFIPNGVNRPEIKEAKFITEKFGLTKDSYILFLGRLVPEMCIRDRYMGLCEYMQGGFFIWKIFRFTGIFRHVPAVTYT